MSAQGNDESRSAAQHGPYHACVCYGHDTTLPNYRRDISLPHTLQGHYAVHGGCPCPPQPPASSHVVTAGVVSCACAHAKSDVAPRRTGARSLRLASGPHKVYKAASAAEATTGVAARQVDAYGCSCGSSGVDKAAATCATHFPNARNYGGTVTQRGPAVLTTASQLNTVQTPSPTSSSALHARACFLRAVLRDEVMAREDATVARDALEAQLQLCGSHHTKELAQTAAAAAARAQSRECAADRQSTPAEQYEQIMDELRYVAAQPLGCKTNIVRLRYLVEEHKHVMCGNVHDAA